MNNLSIIPDDEIDKLPAVLAKYGDQPMEALRLLKFLNKHHLPTDKLETGNIEMMVNYYIKEENDWNQDIDSVQY
jgi:hypothetical protein